MTADYGEMRSNRESVVTEEYRQGLKALLRLQHRALKLRPVNQRGER